MRIIHRDVSDYTVGAVCGGAVLLGLLLSFLLWWCCCRRRNKDNQKLRRKPAIKVKAAPAKQPAKKPVATLEKKLIEQSNMNVPVTAETHQLSPVPPPLSPARMKKVRESSSTIVPIQPATYPSTTSSTSDLVEPESKNSRLEKRYEEGKIASIKINVYHDDNENELVITVVEVRSIHQSVNYQTASVELRRENGRSAGKLTPVRLVQKSGKLKGADKKYRFPMTVEDIIKYKFNFYLWSTDNYSRTYQAGNCLFQFQPSDFADGEGKTTHGDFVKSQKEDTTGCAEITVTLRYINRTSKLAVGIQSISNLPRTGWRKLAHSLSDNSLLQPRPTVKITLLDGDGNVRDTQRTDPIKGYNPRYSKERRFLFDVSLQDLKSHVKLTLELSHSNLRVGHVKIGELEFSWESTGSEGEHWREMIQMISSDQEVPKSHFMRAQSKKLASK